MKILAVQLGRIGDMILATPMYSRIKKLHPDSLLTVLASIPNHSILANNPNVDRILVLDKSPLKLFNLFVKIRAAKYDVLIDAKDHFSKEGTLIAKLSGAKEKIGYNKPGENTYDIPIAGSNDNRGLHYTLRCLKSLMHLGLKRPAEIPRPELFTNAESIEYAESSLKESYGKKIVVVNLSASNRGKMWDNAKWKDFIETIDRHKVFPIISFAPEDKDIADELKTLSTVPSFNSRSLEDVIALISKADLLITPDTSLVHVAAAFDIPLLGLYSGLDDFYTKFAPQSNIREVVRSPKGVDGIKAIQPKELIAAYNRIIERI